MFSLYLGIGFSLCLLLVKLVVLFFLKLTYITHHVTFLNILDG